MYYYLYLDVKNQQLLSPDHSEMSRVVPVCTITDESNTETHIVFRSTPGASDTTMQCSDVTSLDCTAQVLMQAAANLEQASREDLEGTHALRSQDEIT